MGWSSTLVALAQRTPDNYVVSLSERRDRHVYARGFTLRHGFLTTIGNVVSGASGPRRDRVVEQHEQVHVWQARWFGPLYPLLYGAWTLLGAIVGVVAWAIRGRRERLSKVVDTTAYYSNPLEWWAYSREGRWPPPAAIAELTLAPSHRSVTCRETRHADTPLAGNTPIE